MSHIISCRTGIFGEAAVALPKLAACGVTNAEVNVSEGDFPGLLATAEAAGVTITTLSTGVKLDDPDSCESLRTALAGGEGIGVDRFFVSISADVPDAAENTAVLKDLAACAGDHGITLCMETHPPFGRNADDALATLERIDSPHLRFNYDSANLYYYNHNMDGIADLKKCRHMVAAVHLKDTMGHYEGWEFPILGTGIVDFTQVFALLDEIGYDGPYTMELEGKSLSDHEAGPEDFLTQCVAHLRSIGAM